MRRALANEPVPIWNTGNQVIDCCHIDDVAEVFVRAVERELVDKFVRMDVGPGQPVTVKEVAQKVIDLAGSTAGMEFVGKRLGEPVLSNIVADTSQCEQYFGFVPSISIDEGLGRCIDWFKEKYG